MTNFDKIFIAIDKLSRGITLPNSIPSNIVLLHDESKGYVYKTVTNEWKTISFDFANSLAGLGYINRSLI
jgi:hypothetical protein